MFVEKLKKTYGENTPIFYDEIVSLFSNYTKAYVSRLIKKAEEDGELICYSRGVYFIPKETFFGRSTICAETVAEKKYLKDDTSVYGINAGLSILNRFGVTTQVPNTVEIVTNNESSRKREVSIGDRRFIIRKSRCEITKDNYPTYTVLQLFSDMSIKDKLDNFAKSRVKKFMKENDVTAEKILFMSQSFPSTTIKKLIGSGVLNATI